MRFSELSLVPTLHSALRELNISTLSPIQRIALPELLKPVAKRASLIAAPTGTGKTLSYLLPVFQSLKQQELDLAAAGEGSTLTTTASGDPRAAAESANEDEGRVQTRVEGQRMGAPFRRPRAIIVTPTRELADQTLRTIKKLSHHCKLRSLVLINGSTTESSQRRYLESGGADVVVGTPGRINKFREMQMLPVKDVSFLVVDEADMLCDRTFLSEWEASILKPVIGAFRRRAEHEKSEARSDVMFVSATPRGGAANGGAPSDTRDFVEKLAREQLLHFQPLMDPQLYSVPKGIQHEFRRLGAQDRIALLLDVLCKKSKSVSMIPKDGRYLVFCNSIDSARAIEYALHEAIPELSAAGGIVSLHGGIPPDKRWEHYQACKSDKARWIVATDVFARGLDTFYVNHVVHFDFPRSAEDFLHRTGRIGRLSSAKDVLGTNTILFSGSEEQGAKELEALCRRR
eukprot:ANDGO_03637.mRNA.1 DEAD-box ATP-dependent RNA helicase 39